MQDDEEKVVVEESFKAETFTDKKPLEEPNMSSSTSAFELWIIKVEQGINVFLTVRFFYDPCIILKHYVLLEI